MTDRKKAKGDQWMPLYVADYLADTTHLEGHEHGAYLLLLMAYWRNGGPLPADENRLRVIARTSPAAWKAMRDTLAAFFEVTATHWINRRADKELALMRQNVAAKSNAGKLANQARWGRGRDSQNDASAITDGSQTDHRRITDGPVLRSRTDPPSPSPSPIEQFTSCPIPVSPGHGDPETTGQQPPAQRSSNHPDKAVALTWARSQNAGYPERLLEMVWNSFESEAVDGNWIYVDGGGRQRQVGNWQAAFALRLARMGESATRRQKSNPHTLTGVSAAFASENTTKIMKPVEV